MSVSAPRRCVLPRLADARHRSLSLNLPVAVVLFAALSVPLLAQGEPQAGALRDYDARIAVTQKVMSAPSTAQTEGIAQLRQSHGDLLSSFDPTTGVTRSLYRPMGYLSESQGGDALDLARAFLDPHRDALGLSAADLSFEITDDVTSTPTGARRLYLRQTHGGLPVYNGQLQFNFNRDGRLISVNNAFFPNLAQAVPSESPNVDSSRALVLASEHLGLDVETAPQPMEATHGLQQRSLWNWPEMSYEPIEARLMWLPVQRGQVQLVWNFQLFTPDRLHMYDVNVDAHSGQIWTRFDWVKNASYRVFQQPVESPNHADMPPPADGRMLIVDPEETTNASPLGWHDNGSSSFTILHGNNVHAFEDPDGNGSPPATEPDCGAGLVCDFDHPIDFGADDPTDYTDGSVANLFYWVNVLHDIQYQYGFDEAAGNFQTNNFSRGGAGGDAVVALAQKSGAPCPNNASFGTPPDGSSPTLSMCLWTLSSPRRDLAFDNGVIVHEFGHGISTRLVGGPSNVSCLNNPQQGGEGFSDWWSLAYTGQVGDAGTDVRGLATYTVGEPVDGPGIRSQPYSTDPAVNTHTYASMSGLGVPYGVGEVWAQAAWEAYWALVDVRGFDPDLYDALGSAGNQRMMLYVNEGLKNTACSPTLTDVRDGIIQAATDNHGGEDVCTLWQAFADFGLGIDAVSGGPNSTNPTNGFTVPGNCEVGGAIFVDGFEAGDVSAWSTSVP